MLVRYSLKINADRTLTIKVGRQTESIGLLDKDRTQIFEAVKWALISKDAFASDERLTKDLYELIWRHL